MAKAEFHEVLDIDFDKLFNAVIDYENYPRFVENCKETKVLNRKDGVSRVSFQISMMKDVNYTIDQKEDRETGTISWELIESNAFKRNSGFWRLQKAGNGKTDVHYSVEIEFTIPVPGFVLNRLIKNSLPTMIKNFENHARKMG